MTMSSRELTLHNGTSAPLDRLPVLPFDRFREWLLMATESGDRLAALFGIPVETGFARLCAVVASDSAGTLGAAATDVRGSFPSLTPDCPQAHLFEREIAEQCAVTPVGHPWLKPVRVRANGQPSGETDFFRVEGPEVHEVAVGPVHAGIIEPGHFRFQCHGERVLHLEIALGYQHRGVESALTGGPDKRSLHMAETLAGDTTIGHASAYCSVLEALAGVPVPVRSLALRAVALELERMANHTGDLGALAGDIGYLPTMSYCGRIRGDILNLTAELCGNRFGRGILIPGGTRIDADADRLSRIRERLSRIVEDASGAIGLLWDTPSVLARFEGTGTVTPEIARDLGLVGPPARACGLERDVRYTHPIGIFQFHQMPVSAWTTGDVFARAFVRWLEFQRSAQFVLDQIENLPNGLVAAPVGDPARNSLAVALVEGWRGEICHVAMTDGNGRFARYKVVDPSFHNWTGLAMALRDQEISDFPLCNKSFNLSYCGHDL